MHHIKCALYHKEGAHTEKRETFQQQQQQKIKNKKNGLIAWQNCLNQQKMKIQNKNKTKNNNRRRQETFYQFILIAINKI